MFISRDKALIYTKGKNEKHCTQVVHGNIIYNSKNNGNSHQTTKIEHGGLIE